MHSQTEALDPCLFKVRGSNIFGDYVGSIKYLAVAESSTVVFNYYNYKY